MSVLFSIFKRLFNGSKSTHFSANPYELHLQLLIKHQLVPFTTVADLFEHRISEGAVWRMHLQMLLGALNLFRLTAIIIGRPTPFVRQYLVPYFGSQENNWYFHVSLLVIFSLTAFLYCNLYYMSCYSEGGYCLFEVFQTIIVQKEYQLTADRIRRLDFGMKLFPPLYRVVLLLSRLSLATLPLADMAMYANFGAFSPLQVAMYSLWTALLLPSISIVAAIGVLLAQQVYVFNGFNMFRLMTIWERMTAQKKSSQPALFAPTSFSFKQKTFPLTPVLRRHLFRELTHLATTFLAVSEQFKYQPTAAYYTLGAVIEFNLFLGIARSTSALLRVVSLCTFVVCAFLFLFSFSLMAELNSRSKYLLPELEVCLFRGTNFRRPTAKLALAELHHLISANWFSINFADIFRMTRAALLKACVTIMANVFLIINLSS